MACQSVSRRRLYCSMEQGNFFRERDVDPSIGYGGTRNTYSGHSKFSENNYVEKVIQAEKVVDRTGKPMGESSSNAQISS